MLNFEMTQTHPTLGRLKIGFSVNERGEFALDLMDIRWRWKPYAYPHFWTVHCYWRTLDNQWGMAWWDSRWSNGVKDSSSAYAEAHMTFLPALLDFANSPEFAALVGRKLKRARAHWVR